MAETRKAATKSVSPEGAFLVLGVICGLLFTFVTPPFQAPDEPVHFYRAFHLSELRFFDVILQGRAAYPGALLPRALAAIVSNSDLVATRFQPAAKLIPSRMIAGLKIPLDSSQREYLPVAGYPPVGYIPQAAGIAIGRAVGLSPLLLLYCGRLAALAVWIALVFLSIKRTPVLKWTFFLLALMPMSIYMAASSSIDGFVIGVTFLAGATLLEWTYDEAKSSIGRMDIGWLALIGVGITMSKAIYLSVMFLFLLIPLRKFKSRKAYWIGFASVMLAGIVAFWGWNWLKNLEAVPGPAIQFAGHGVDVTTFSGVAPDRQTQFLTSNPAVFVNVVANTVAANGFVLLHSFVGQLGWLDTVLPLWLPYVYIGMLIASSWDARAIRVTGMERGAAAAIFAATTFVLLLLVYTSTNPVGASDINHLQGRYFIPMAPVLFLIFHRNVRARGRLAPLLVVLFAALSAGIAAHCVMKRFYWGPGFVYRIERASAEEGWLTVAGWAAARNGGDISGGIELGVDGSYYPVRSGIDRPDVARELGDPALELSGFEGKIRLADLAPASERRIDLRIKNGEGGAYVVPKLRLILTAPESGMNGP